MTGSMSGAKNRDGPAKKATTTKKATPGKKSTLLIQEPPRKKAKFVSKTHVDAGSEGPENMIVETTTRRRIPGSLELLMKAVMELDHGLLEETRLPKMLKKASLSMGCTIAEMCCCRPELDMYGSQTGKECVFHLFNSVSDQYVRRKVQDSHCVSHFHPCDRRMHTLRSSSAPPSGLPQGLGSTNSVL